VCPIIKAARAAALAHEQAPGASRAASSLVGGPSIPPYPGLRQRQSSAQDLLALAAGNAASGKGPIPAAAAAAASAGAGCAVAAASAGSGGLSQGAFGSPLGSFDGSALARECQSKSAPLPSAAAAAGGADGGSQTELQQTLSNSSSSNGSSSFDGSPREGSPAAAAAAAGSVVEPRLFVLGNGSGSPCLDLSRVPAALADATVGVDLLVSDAVVGGLLYMAVVRCGVQNRTYIESQHGRGNDMGGLCFVVGSVHLLAWVCSCFSLTPGRTGMNVVSSAVVLRLHVVVW
jgi:type II pantothenate kinase